jgi:hypothetical protein
MKNILNNDSRFLTGGNNNNTPITPAVIYPNACTSKDQILKDKHGKSGVYLIFFC